MESKLDSKESRLVSPLDSKSILSHSLLKLIFYIFFLPLAFLAGMASEQIGLVSILSLILLNAFCLYKRHKIPVFLNIALLFFIIGWLVLYLSPGHANRARIIVEMGGAYMKLSQILALDAFSLIKRFGGAIMAFKNHTILLLDFMLLLPLANKRGVKGILMLLFAMVLIAVLHKHFKYFWLLNLFILGISLVILAFRDRLYLMLLLLFGIFCICMLSIVQVLGLPHRARLGDSMILLAMVLLVYERCDIRRIYQGGVIVICAIYAAYVGFAFVEYRIKWEDMVSFIEESKRQGISDIEVDNIFSSRYRNFMNWGNPGSNPKAWPNPSYARYFEVDSFKVKE